MTVPTVVIIYFPHISSPFEGDEETKKAQLRRHVAVGLVADIPADNSYSKSIDKASSLVGLKIIVTTAAP